MATEPTLKERLQAERLAQNEASQEAQDAAGFLAAKRTGAERQAPQNFSAKEVASAKKALGK